MENEMSCTDEGSLLNVNEEEGFKLAVGATIKTNLAAPNLWFTAKT